MPSARGLLVVTLGAVLLGVGITFGARSLEQLGFALVALTAVALVVVRMGRYNLTVTRTVVPQRARPGQEVGLEFQIANRGRRAAPLLLFEDRLPGGVAGSARFSLQGIKPGGDRRASVPLKILRRGKYEIGPLSIQAVDPFGLARVTSTAAGTTTLLVHPRSEQLALPRDQGERRSLSTSALRQPTGARGEDFYTLREYAEGDDLRRIHWPSTAKRGKYMIKQEETPWHTRATVVLDDRASAHDRAAGSSSFERAVEAAASLVDLYHRSGYGLRLTLAHHRGVAAGRGSDHLTRCLDLLATVELPRAAPSDDALLLRLAELESSSQAEASLVVVAGSISAAEATAIARCRRSFRQTAVICFPAHRYGGGVARSRWEGERQIVDVVRLLARSQVRMLVVGPGESLHSGWATLMQSRAGQERAWGRKPELV
jgi:uncharacterized protein (DUF58 family)